MRITFKTALIALSALVLGSIEARADEGMWMVNAIDKAVHARMKARGLKLSAKEIYNADAPGTSLTDAVVSMDFGCTGSIISHGSLVITNHHCAYDDVHSLSTAEKNYLEDGFWAGSQQEEIRIPGKSVQMLKRVIDVTDEVNTVYDTTGSRGRMFGFRRVSGIIEKKYSDLYGLEAVVASMWSGTKYYVALYKEYDDVRLVAAPPVSIAAFGGDIDNWEWPQHKCDFAIYRIYEDGKPLQSAKKLDIAKKPLKQGDYAMVIGYPGRTNRYNSSYKTEFEKDITLPIESQTRGEVMAIIKKWMDADPVIRLKYSDKFFSLSNVQELYLGEVQCYNRFGVVEERRQEEEANLRKDYPGLLDSLAHAYSVMAAPQTELEYYRESMVRGSDFYAIQTRAFSLTRPKVNAQNTKEAMRGIYARIDLRVEKELFKHALGVFYSKVSPSYWGAYQKELFEKFEGNPEAVAEWILDQSWTTKPEKVEEFYAADDVTPYLSDPLIKFYKDSEYIKYSTAVSEAQGDYRVSSLGSRYTQALYASRAKRGIPQYPDANSTMRVTYGTVGGFSPRDAVRYDWKSSVSGILEKYNPSDYDFNLKPEWKSLLESAPQDMCADFLTDNDITGGNSGSPVLNARGELVGLAFDGNKESLAGDVSFTNGYNKCVCTDIQFVLFTLGRYAGMDWILNEINR